jgi:hypothetical protein
VAQTAEPPEHEFCRNCGGDNAAIRKIAETHNFSYDEAFTYVMIIGLAYASRPPQTAQEPGE